MARSGFLTPFWRPLAQYQVVTGAVLTDREVPMRDLAYVALILTWFGLLLAFVHGCMQLGRDSSREEERW